MLAHTHWLSLCLAVSPSLTRFADGCVCVCVRAASIQALADQLTPATLADTVLPVALSLASDPIPNIRFNVAKTLEAMAPCLRPAHRAVLDGHVRPTLERLAGDTDADVRFFARHALQGKRAFVCESEGV
jgi:hypothetical protein